MGAPAPGAYLLAAAGVAAFLAHEGALVQLGQRGGRATRELGVEARRSVALFGGFCVVTGLVALTQLPTDALVWLAPLLLVNLVADYAKVRAVVEDRHSMVGALVAGARFVVRHPISVLAVYAANALIAGAILLVYVLVAPDGRGGDWRLMTVLVVGGAYLGARLATRQLWGRA